MSSLLDSSSFIEEGKGIAESTDNTELRDIIAHIETSPHREVAAVKEQWGNTAVLEFEDGDSMIVDNPSNPVAWAKPGEHVVVFKNRKGRIQEYEALGFMYKGQLYSYETPAERQWQQTGVSVWMLIGEALADESGEVKKRLSEARTRIHQKVVDRQLTYNLRELNDWQNTRRIWAGIFNKYAPYLTGRPEEMNFERALYEKSVTNALQLMAYLKKTPIEAIESICPFDTCGDNHEERFFDRMLLDSEVRGKFIAYRQKIGLSITDRAWPSEEEMAA